LRRRRIARFDPAAPERLAAFVAAGQHGSMAWLKETAARRGRPSALWPDVRSIVMLGMNYGPESDPLAALAKRIAARSRSYAQNRDYHDVVKGKLKELAGKIAARAAATSRCSSIRHRSWKKPLAEAAGLGWQGKHTNLVSRQFGSWLFLGSIFTTAELEPDAAWTTIAARAALASTSVRPTPFRHPTSSMRGVAFPT